jgi:hypothetical protein
MIVINKLAKYTLILFFLAIGTIGMSQENDTLKYIFLGHIKLKQNGLDKVDPRVAGLDMSYFDRIWLGGDITDESNLNYETLEYIDSLFDVSNPSNCWAFGNHDQRNYNDEWLRKITGKNSYYTYFENGITTMVVNYGITPADCEQLNDQFNMIKTVCDTISESSHLIILSHYCPWRNVPSLPNPFVYGHSDFKNWIANCDDDAGQFVYSIYPLLKEVKNKGITVINIMGDCGATKGRIMESDHGIYFIASGIQANTQDEYGPDRVLLIKHVPANSFLDWEFLNLDSLYATFQ